MEENTDIELKLQSSEFFRNEADKYIKLYKNAKTERQKAGLIKTLHSLQGRLSFHLREVEDLMDEPDDYNRGF